MPTSLGLIAGPPAVSHAPAASRPHEKGRFVSSSPRHRSATPGRHRQVRRQPVAIAAAVTAITAGSIAIAVDSGPARAAASPCSAMTTTIHSSLGPAGSQLLTSSGSESSTAAIKSGYSSKGTTSFLASAKKSSGLVAVVRLKKAKANDFLYTTSSGEAKSAVSKNGYVQEKIAFYAAAKPTTCEVAVQRYRKGAQHRYGVAADGARLRAAGWHYEGVSWYARLAATPVPPPSSPSTPSSSPSSSASAPSAPHSSTPPSTSPSQTSSTPSPVSSSVPPPSQPSQPGGASTPLPLTQQLYVATKNRNDIAAFGAAAAGSDSQRLLWQLANTQIATWLGGASSDAAMVDGIVSAASAVHQTPAFVLYAIPHRDGCGPYSKGGMASQAAYQAWVDSIHSAIRGRPAIVIIEPDAIGYGCLPTELQAERIAELQYDINKFASATNPNIVAYLHAGSSGISPTNMANALNRVGIAKIRGFAVNVASYDSTASETVYGRAIGKALGTDQPFVIDTSRNGLGRQPGADSSCNPPVQAVGTRPTTRTGLANVDALLWLHTSGGSDGQCHPGDPGAGTFVPAWATQYVQSAIDRGIIHEYPLGQYATS